MGRVKIPEWKQNILEENPVKKEQFQERKHEKKKRERKERKHEVVLE